MTSYHLDVPFAAPISQGYKGLAKYFYSPSGFIVLQHFFALEEFADFDTFDSWEHAHRLFSLDLVALYRLPAPPRTERRHLFIQGTCCSMIVLCHVELPYHSYSNWCVSTSAYQNLSKTLHHTFFETPKCLDTVSLVSLWPAMAFRTKPSHDPRPVQLAVFWAFIASAWWHPWHPRYGGHRAGDGNAAVPLGWTDEHKATDM